MISMDVKEHPEWSQAGMRHEIKRDAVHEEISTLPF